MASIGTTWQRGLREVMSAGRDEIVDVMIQGDLAESVWSVVATTCSWCCDRWSRCGPVVGSNPVGRGSYNPMGKCDPMLFEESDGS